MSSNDPFDDLDRTNESFSQVEVSHGSTSNQTSMYASTSSVSQNASRTFCLDLFNVILIFASFIFVLLFCYDHIPKIASYFDGRHPKEKIIVTVISILVTCIFVIILVVRCLCRSRYCACHQSVETAWYKRKRHINVDASILFEEEDTTDTYFPKPSRHTSEGLNARLSELPEPRLYELKQILTIFLNYHDSEDWSLSPPSKAHLSKEMLGNSPPQLRQKAKIKFTVKVILLGSPNVGKTSIFHRILYDRFSEYYMATLGADLGHITLHIFPKEFDNHVAISLQLWDIAGSERFSELSHIVYKDATSFIVVCDVVSPTCSEVALPWIKDVKSLVYEPHISLFLNKIDLSQKSATLGNLSGEITHYQSYSISAKTGEKVLDNLVNIISHAVIHEIDKLL